jgi:hypothetical protein
MRVRRNGPKLRREAFTTMMYYAPMPGRLDLLPGYGAPEDEIVFLPSTPTVESVPAGSSKPSAGEWVGLGKELFQLVNGVWTQVRDKQGRPVRQQQQVAYIPPPAPNYLPIVLGGLAVLGLIVGAAAYFGSGSESK